MVGDQQRILLSSPTLACLVLVLSICVVTTTATGGGTGDTEKLKVLSFGGNGNIGSAVLAKMIETNKFDIVMTTRGGWHWDSDTRIGTG